MTTMLSPSPRVTAPVASTAAGPGVRAPRPRWHLVYFVLAGFDLVAVTTGVYLNHRITSSFSESVAVNQEWAQRLAAYSTLGRLAGGVNAPGNDVFDSRDVDAERRRMDAALVTFAAAMVEARKDIESHVSAPDRDIFLSRLVGVDQATAEMVAEAGRIFEHFRNGQPDRAGERMATMDRKYAQVSAALADLQNEVRSIQTRLFHRQASDVDVVRRFEFVSGALIALMVFGVAFYGSAMSRAMRIANEEADSSLAALAASEARLRSIVEGAADGIVTFDGDGTILSANPAVKAIVGYEASDLVGRPIALVLPALGGPVGPALARLADDDASRAATRLELEALRRDNRRAFVALSVSAVTTDAGTRYTALVHDQTRDHMAKDALERAKQAAEDANRAKSAFLANMSHELRTPLNAIIGYSEMLEEDATDRGDDTPVADLKRIQAAGRHLLALIGDILDLSKVEAGRMSVEVEELDANRLIEEVLSTVRPMADKNHNELQISCAADLGIIVSDGRRLRQVLLNLLSNACKFTDHGVVWLIAWREQTPAGDSLVFQIKDTGIGMAPDALGRLFMPFMQADASTTRKFGGTGLGLTISRRLTQLLGGDIAVESTAGRGSTFTVRVAASLKNAMQVPDTRVIEKVRARAPQDTTSNTVLVIDDDPMVQQRLSKLLSKEGLEPVVAESGPEGLRLARDLQPAAITLDVLMPDMDGWSVLSALKADPDLVHIPVIIVSIMESTGLSYAMGAADFVPKPVDPVDLSRALHNLLGHRVNGRVLVVDDDDDSRQLMRRRMEALGWSAAEARNGREALDCVAGERPDLVLLDLMMPELDGFAFLDEVRKSDALRDLPVIVVTAKDLTADERERLRGDVVQLVSKSEKDADTVLREVGDSVTAYVKRRRGAA